MDTAIKSYIEQFMTKERANYSEISKKSGVSISTLCRIMSGEIKNPSKSTLEQLSKCFKIPVSKLINENIWKEIEEHKDDINHIKIRDRLIYLMKRARILNIETLASMTDLSVTSIKMIISGETKKPNMETCLKLANFFGITIKQLKCEELISEEENLYKEIPIINIGNIKTWLETRSNKYIESFKSILLVNSKNTFCVEINDNNLWHEYSKGDLLIFEEKSNIGDGKYVANINNTIDIYQIYQRGNIVRYRHIGTQNIFVTELESVKIFAKLIEVKVN